MRHEVRELEAFVANQNTCNDDTGHSEVTKCANLSNEESQIDHKSQIGPSRFVLDYLTQNGSDRHHFDPSKIWIGPNEFYFGTFSQFGPSKSQVGFTNLTPPRCNSWNYW